MQHEIIHPDENEPIISLSASCKSNSTFGNIFCWQVIGRECLDIQLVYDIETYRNHICILYWYVLHEGSNVPMIPNLSSAVYDTVTFHS